MPEAQKVKNAPLPSIVVLFFFGIVKYSPINRINRINFFNN